MGDRQYLDATGRKVESKAPVTEGAMGNKPPEVVEIEDAEPRSDSDNDELEDEEGEDYDDTESLLMDILNEEFEESLESKSTNTPLGSVQLSFPGNLRVWSFGDFASQCDVLIKSLSS